MGGRVDEWVSGCVGARVCGCVWACGRVGMGV